MQGLLSSHYLIKEKLSELIKLIFNREGSLNSACNENPIYHFGTTEKI